MKPKKKHKDRINGYISFLHHFLCLYSFQLNFEAVAVAVAMAMSSLTKHCASSCGWLLQPSLYKSRTAMVHETNNCFCSMSVPLKASFFGYINVTYIACLICHVISTTVHWGLNQHQRFWKPYNDFFYRNHIMILAWKVDPRKGGGAYTKTARPKITPLAMSVSSCADQLIMHVLCAPSYEI